MNRLEAPFLGTLIKYPELIEKFEAWIPDPKFFEHQSHQDIWVSILRMRSAGVKIEPNMIIHYTNKDIVDISFLNRLMSFSNKDNVENYAKTLFDSYIKARLIESQNAIFSQHKTMSAERLMQQSMAMLDELSAINPYENSSGEFVVPTASKIIKSGANIIRYGIPFMDSIAGGGTRGEMAAIAARPGHGKTTLSANIVKSLAEQKYSVVVFNREMSNPEFYKKLYVLESDILTASNLRARKLSKEIQDEIDRLTPILTEKYKHLYTYDNIRDINGAVAEIHRKRPAVVIDDFVQMVQSDGDDRKDKIKNIFAEYSAAAKRANSHIVIISQMNREVERRLDYNPVLSDFADASEIEWYCESALFLQHKYKYDWEQFPENRIDIFCLKARYGKVGSYEQYFDGDKCIIK